MPKNKQTNINLTIEDTHKVERMMIEDGIDNRSGFMRRLVRQEWARRYQVRDQVSTTNVITVDIPTPSLIDG